MYKIFDSHTHSYPEAISEKAVSSLAAFYEFELNALGTYEDLQEMERQGGSSGFMMFAAATNPSQVVKANDYIANIFNTKSTPDMRIIGAGAMHHDYPDKLGEVERLIKLGFKGFKLHPDIMRVDIDDPRLLDFYAMLEGRMILYIHVGDDRYNYSHPKKLLKIYEMFPNLTIVGAHLGGYTMWDDYEANFMGKNIYLDTSSALWALPAQRATEIIKKHGADKILFGTDYPVSSVRRELEFLMKLDLTDHERQNILYNNAARLFGL